MKTRTRRTAVSRPRAIVPVPFSHFRRESANAELDRGTVDSRRRPDHAGRELCTRRDGVRRRVARPPHRSRHHAPIDLPRDAHAARDDLRAVRRLSRRRCVADLRSRPRRRGPGGHGAARGRAPRRGSPAGGARQPARSGACAHHLRREGGVAGDVDWQRDTAAAPPRADAWDHGSARLDPDPARTTARPGTRPRRDRKGAGRPASAHRAQPGLDELVGPCLRLAHRSLSSSPSRCCMSTALRPR